MSGTKTITLLAFFQDEGSPKTGLSPTVNIYDLGNDSLVVTGGILSEVGGGFYKYRFTEYNENANYAYLVDGSASLSDTDRYKFNGNDLMIVEQRMSGIEDDIRQIRNFFRQFKDDHAGLYDFMDKIKNKDFAGPVVKQVSSLMDRVPKISKEDIEMAVNSAIGNIKIPDQVKEKIDSIDIKKILSDELKATAEHIVRNIEKNRNELTSEDIKREVSGIENAVNSIIIPPIPNYSGILKESREDVLAKYEDIKQDIIKFRKEVEVLKVKVTEDMERSMENMIKAAETISCLNKTISVSSKEVENKVKSMNEYLVKNVRDIETSAKRKKIAERMIARLGM